MTLRILKDPLFHLGLVIRAILVVAVVAQPLDDWYLPFLEKVGVGTVDPWGHWLASGGAANAFPYGYVMWLVFLPAVLIAKVGIPLHITYGATLIAVDLVLLGMLGRMWEARPRRMILLYWLSPIVIVATYVLGYNDIVPTALMVLALLCIQQRQFVAAGICCVAAVSAKLSMAIAIPFLLVYLVRNRPLIHRAKDFLIGLGIGGGLFLLPAALLAPDAFNMQSKNPEVQKVYAFAIDLGNVEVYLLPLLAMVMLYVAWTLRRSVFEILYAIIGLMLLTLVLLTPAPPGWFVWTVPLLVLHQLRGGRIADTIVGAFGAAFVVASVVGPPDPLDLEQHVGGSWVHLDSLAQTVLVTIGLVLVARIGRDHIRRHEYYRLSRKPLAIGIAGDSGAGKDTLVDSLTGLFGARSVASISGDDYHLWDRHKPMWHVMTHLNPAANNLKTLERDAVALTDGRAVMARHYDHATGKMSRPFRIRSNDFVLVSGLHTLLLPLLQQRLDLSIYLDIDEGLRRQFKIDRDVHQRGHSLERVLSSLEKREPDSQKFIRPQAEIADLILAIQPVGARARASQDQPLKLRVTSSRGIVNPGLLRALIGVCGLHVDTDSMADGSAVMTIEGEIDAEDVAMAVRIACPRILSFLAEDPVWEPGVGGLMQIVTLDHIDQHLTTRLL